MVLNSSAYFFCFGDLPVPVSGITWNVPDALSKTINDPVAGVVSVGVNVTLNFTALSRRQYFFMQLDVTANGGAKPSH